MKFAKPVRTALAVLMLSFPALEAQAALNAVDPGPYLEANGFFPAWYQDSNGRALELCLSTATIAADAARGLAGGAGCTLLANPGVFNPAQPIAFPSNFPDESFWFMGDAVLNSGGVVVNYVSNLEAAFASGLPTPGGQISFARIRIRVSLPANAPAGNYTVIHPYGVEVFGVVAGGVKVVNLTRDVGIGGNTDFTGPLKGDIGPFLMDASVPTQGLIPGTDGVSFFVGDPNSLRPVVGSPFGTNFLRIEGPAGFTPVQQNLFTVMGKVFTTEVLPTPALIERTTYSRAAGATVGSVVAQQDVFVKAPPTSVSVTFEEPSAAVTTMTDGDKSGGWFGQSTNPPVPGGLISVRADNPPLNSDVTTTSTLVDLITISKAEATCSAGSCSITVEAASSDQVAVPTLTVNGTTDMAPVVAGGTLQTATFTVSPIPPAQVTVTSTNGGSDTENVVIVPVVIVP